MDARGGHCQGRAEGPRTQVSPAIDSHEACVVVAFFTARARQPPRPTTRQNQLQQLLLVGLALCCRPVLRGAPVLLLVPLVSQARCRVT